MDDRSVRFSRESQLSDVSTKSVKRSDFIDKKHPCANSHVYLLSMQYGICTPYCRPGGVLRAQLLGLDETLPPEKSGLSMMMGESFARRILRILRLLQTQAPCLAKKCGVAELRSL